MFYARPMDRVGVRDLNQNTSRYLARVKAGETIEVTEHGRPVARLVPVQPTTGLLDRLVTSGEAQPPTAAPATLTPLGPPTDDLDVAAELAAARDEERW